MEKAQERFNPESAVERFWPHYELGWIDMTEDSVEASRRWAADALTLAALSHESRGSAEVAARLLGGAAAVAASMGESPQPLPVMARLTAAAEARLAAALGAEVLAEYAAAGRSTSVPGLLQTALAGRRMGRDR
jgi:hypothetical protein